jgi:hypothetical protein
LGIIDRDYWHIPGTAAASGRAYRPPEPSLWPWTVGIAVTTLIGVVVLAPLHWFPDWLVPIVAEARQGTQLSSQSQSTPSPQPRPQRDLVIAPAARAGASAQREASPAPAARMPAPAQLAADDPFKKPGTIYRCRSTAGAFWSDTHCSRHNAVIDRIASVPIGLPFLQQVDIASQEANQLEATLNRERREGERASLCASLSQERDTIWKRSGNGAGYVPLDILGKDQTRWKEIESLLNANGCRR